jgi:receptor expression-enhancing protein 5/6
MAEHSDRCIWMVYTCIKSYMNIKIILIMDDFNEIIEELYRSSENWRLLRFIAKKFNIQSGSVVLVFISICFLFILLGVHEKIICDTLTFAFPAWWTMHSIKNANLANNKLWISYWMIYSTLKLLDHYISFIIQFVPLYYLIKSIFLITLSKAASKIST